MKFTYLKFPLPLHSSFFGPSILRPIIPLNLTHGGRSVAYQALIDSGADFCIFDAELGEYLGLDIRSGERLSFGGIQEAKEAEGFVHTITLVIGGHEYKTKVVFSYDIARHGSGILGQKGFFDLFEVCFDLTKERIELMVKKDQNAV